MRKDQQVHKHECLQEQCHQAQCHRVFSYSLPEVKNGYKEYTYSYSTGNCSWTCLKYNSEQFYTGWTCNYHRN